jgi:hypothetical protein
LLDFFGFEDAPHAFPEDLGWAWGAVIQVSGQ